MSNLTADSPRAYETQIEPLFTDQPAAAAAIYEGAAVTINGSGYANHLVYTEEFLGFCVKACDNSAGNAGDLNVRVHARGIIKLNVTGATALTNVNDVVYATDGNTFTLTSTNALAIGRVFRWISSGVCMVYFNSVSQTSLTSIGTGTGTSLAVTGALTSSSPSAGIGYATGAGGAVTQLTDRTTGVTLSKTSGTITTDTTSLAAGASAEFTVTNTACAIGDVPIVAIRSGATTTATVVKVSTVAAGSFKIVVTNGHASTAETGAIIINFAIVKAVAA